MKKWLTNNFLPMWAKETVLKENRNLQRKVLRLELENDLLKAKIDGMEAVLKARRRQCLNYLMSL